jgi:hypothetical protein
MHFGRGAFRTEHFGNEEFFLKQGITELLPDPDFKNIINPDEESEEESELIQMAFDSDSLINFEQEETEDLKLNGISEYAWGLWSRWSRTGPKNLATKQDFHSLARFTTNRNHKDAQMKDRTLAVWIGEGFYHFTTYNIQHGKEEPNII